MPIIKVENGYIYKKTSKRTNKKALFVFLLFLTSVFVMSAILFAFSKFDVTSALNLNKYLIFEEKSYYAVSVTSGDDYSQIKNEIDDIKLQNGAGFVLNQNGEYFLIANTYEKKEDAEKVSSSLSGYSAEVVEINLQKLVLSTSYTAEQIKVLRDSLNLVNRAFSKLYEVSISLDRGEILDAEARQKLQVFKEICQEGKQTLSNVFQNNLDNIITHVKIFQSEVISNLSMLIVSRNLSSDIKYANISILSSFVSLQKNVTR